MSRIAAAFAKCKAEKRAAFIPFIMGGDPSIEASAKLLDALPAAGADIIELGIPFSDPMADGPTIQAAGLRALEAGATLKKIIALAAEFRKKHVDVPLVLMGYLNPIFIYGYDAFARDAAAAGVDGVIIVDLPPEEAAELEPQLTKAGISLVRLIAPTSVPERLPLLVKGASGYLYFVSITGITGAGSATNADIEKNIAAIRKVTDLPVAVGFGVKTTEQVKAFGKLADGVVVGSAIVQKIFEHKGDVKAVSAYVASLAK
ncbi:MAG: tryptophan synthase subunit alpha [Alphaproteobacteria bacterium]|nr:tryptophan synthase subunit alpha [Alphaproteobacteria bacterium]